MREQKEAEEQKNYGFGFNSQGFTSSVQGGLVSAVGGMTSTFTSGLFGQMNLGDKVGNSFSKVTGFSGQNIGDMGTLNNFLGGLAGQGVQYAMGGDFTMNILNTNMLGIGGGVGLFEVGFGRDGFRAGIGMGGMDASFGTIASAVRGAAA